MLRAYLNLFAQTTKYKYSLFKIFPDKLIGISNQSGISRGTVTEEQVIVCMNKTREMLGIAEKDFPISYCPHNPAPITCYCRKPQVGQVINFVDGRLRSSGISLVGILNN